MVKFTLDISSESAGKYYPVILGVIGYSDDGKLFLNDKEIGYDHLSREFIHMFEKILATQIFNQKEVK